MKYSTALGDKICKAIARSSVGLRNICKQLNIPYSTVTDWIYDPAHELHGKYLQAKQMQLHVLAEEVCTMVDELTNYDTDVAQNGKKTSVLHREHISRTRLRMQARIAIITKLAPALYGGTKPQKTKHTVTMTPPPHHETTPPLPQQQLSTKRGKVPVPAPPQYSSTAVEERFPVTSSAPSSNNAGEGPSSPKNTFKYLPDGTFEEYNERGKLIRKSCKPYTPPLRWV